MRERLAARAREHERSRWPCARANSSSESEVRDEFLSIASHELRTAVTGIGTPGSSCRRRRSARLAVSRIRLGQLPLRLQELDLAELVGASAAATTISPWLAAS